MIIRGSRFRDACVVTEHLLCAPSVLSFYQRNGDGSFKAAGGGGSGLCAGDGFMERFGIANLLCAASREPPFRRRAADGRDPEETTTISNFEDVEGVYVINGGYESFHRITRLYQSNGYSIIEGVDLYDRILIPEQERRVTDSLI